MNGCLQDKPLTLRDVYSQYVPVHPQVFSGWTGQVKSTFKPIKKKKRQRGKNFYDEPFSV